MCFLCVEQTKLRGARSSVDSRSKPCCLNNWKFPARNWRIFRQNEDVSFQIPLRGAEKGGGNGGFVSDWNESWEEAPQELSHSLSPVSCLSPMWIHVNSPRADASPPNTTKGVVLPCG